MTLLREYHEELEFDLLALGVDLLDLYHGKLSPRRLWVLIRGLPMTSRLKRAINPEAAAESEWTPTSYLMAELIDFAHGVNQNKKLTARLPRPGEAAAERAKREAQLRELLAMQERNQQRAMAQQLEPGGE